MKPAWIVRILFLLLLLASAGFAQKKDEAKPKFTNDDCLACHNDPTLTKEENGKSVSLGVDPKKFAASIHGQMFQCVDCHTDVKDVPHSVPPGKPSCAQCHADEQKQYDSGVHAKAVKAGIGQAARCSDCHGSVHEILPASDPASLVNHLNIPKTCDKCHTKTAVMNPTGVSTAPAVSYSQSVHGEAVAGGSEKAAVCTDCHEKHAIRPANDPASSISKSNVPATCAKCHQKEATQFEKSIHGKELAAGDLHAPACTDCHGIHTILAPGNPQSSVSAENLAKNTCARCHNSVRMSEEFGIPGRRATTYFESYHGLATEMGSSKAANCASCHGVHDILPSSDPNSTINPRNLVATCGKCHAGANANFANSKVHVDPAEASDLGSKFSRIARDFYLLMIFATIGGMLVHNLLIMRKKLKDRREGHVHIGGGERVVVRMTRLQRRQHLVLLTSFLTLVLTGFALKYPESILGTIFINEAVRRYIHRTAGAVLIAVGLYHVFYVIRYKEGRKLVSDLMPRYQDAIAIRDVLLYYLGLSKKKPEFPRFGYAEKMEYWALVWGTIVMAVTGLMAWFKVPVGDLLPRWSIDVGMTVHFYEAILATLAILVWHFYMVIFDPDVYPMNWAWYDGKMTIEQYREEHALDSETILAAMQLEAEKQAAENSETASEQTVAAGAEAGRNQDN
ncbi:MAG: cytochrome b/b6 domain-containing protein [Terriglobia bacterium]|nr:cytochrome b/b6 domain-containing protein [Terriglobia bacterium]